MPAHRLLDIANDMAKRWNEQQAERYTARSPAASSGATLPTTMIVKPLPLLSVFAAGCLSGALFIAVWRADSGDIPTSRARERATPSDASRTAQPPHEHAIERAVNDDRSSARIEPTPQKMNEYLGGEPPTEPGTSVADVLTRLEVAYHEGITAARQGDTPKKTSAISEAPPPELPAREETARAVADTAPPPETVPQAGAPTESAPQTDVQAFARRHDAPPRNQYEVDVRQNVHVSNVQQQGDVNHIQQVLVLQYFQLLTILPQGQLASPVHTARRKSKRHTRPFSTSLTTPTIAGGFIPAPVLVR